MRNRSAARQNATTSAQGRPNVGPGGVAEEPAVGKRGRARASAAGESFGVPRPVLDERPGSRVVAPPARVLQVEDVVPEPAEPEDVLDVVPEHPAERVRGGQAR